jgi:phospholipase C
MAHRAASLLLLALGLLPTTLRAQIDRFEHVVVVIQENRTPDNLFQGLCSPPYGSAASCSVTPGPGQYDIQTSAWKDRSAHTHTTNPTPIALANKYDLDHSHTAWREQCDLQIGDKCAMDGAALVGCDGVCPPRPQFRYVSNARGILAPYLKLATQYGWANEMFQTNQGPSFPAHQFLFGATSAPSAADDAAGIFASENMKATGGTGGLSVAAGCAALASTSVYEIQPSVGEIKTIYPCFDHETVPDLLPTSLTWRYYAPSAGAIWTAPNAIEHLCESSGPGGHCTGTAWTQNVDLVPADVLKDIAACQLRSVSWVTPSCQNSDHAKCNDGGGPSWVASIVNAIGKSATCDGGAGYWKNTAIVVVWDDWGGWYDHVVPTLLPAPQGDYQYGFRVPMLFVSAYTAPRTIDNVHHDFGSIVRFVEENFGIQEGALSFADKRASSDLSGLYDLQAAPRAFTPIPAPHDARFFLEDKRVQLDPDDD